MININDELELVKEKVIQGRKLEKEIEEEAQTVNTLKKKKRRIEKAIKISQVIAKTLQEKAHIQISSIVTECLKSVFPDKNYKFIIDFVQRRNKTEAELLLLDGENKIDPLNSNGGGLIDVISFALRLSYIILKRPFVRRLLILDEPFKFVSSVYIENIGNLLLKLSEKFNIQIIMVTHIEALKMGHIIKI